MRNKRLVSHLLRRIRDMAKMKAPQTMMDDISAAVELLGYYLRDDPTKVNQAVVEMKHAMFLLGADVRMQNVAFTFLQTLDWDPCCTLEEHGDLLHYVARALAVHSDNADLHEQGLAVIVTIMECLEDFSEHDALAISKLIVDILSRFPGNARLRDVSVLIIRKVTSMRSMKVSSITLGSYDE